MVTIRWRPRQGHCPPTFLLINQASGKEIPILTKRWAFSPASRGDFSLLFEVTAHTNRATQRCCINEIRLQIHPWKRTRSKGCKSHREKTSTQEFKTKWMILALNWRLALDTLRFGAERWL